MTANLPSGYHHDLQLLKEHIIPAFSNLNDCLKMATLMLGHIDVKKELLSDEKYAFLFSVEEVNKLVLQGVPFRDAYLQVGTAIEAGEFKHSNNINHTHEGSIGNLCLAEISGMMDDVVQKFNFAKVKIALQQLIS